MNSVWAKGIERPRFEALEGDISTDVLIIGGGLTGILCTYMLKKAGVDYTLIEAKRLCEGVTGNTTAKLTVQHGLIYDKLIKAKGIEAAAEYYAANNKALAFYKTLCRELGCDFLERDAYVYSMDNRDEIEAEVKAYEKLGAAAFFTQSSPLPFEISGAVGLTGQGQINPLEFLYKLSKDLNIKENTKLTELKKGEAKTNRGSIKFKKAIIATHFPIINKHGMYFLKLYQHRSYVVALKGAKGVGGMYVDADIKGLSFRDYGELLLLGGGSHRTGKQGGSYTELMDFAAEHYPKAQMETRFATQDCMSLDGIPYIGRYSKNTPELYVATGYNKWGWTSAMAAAQMLCRMITEDKGNEASVFNPTRGILHPQLAVNGIETTLNLLTPTAPRCPHMGCALKFNRQERSWDCPCHGSRFTFDGSLIDNPATDDMKGI